MRCVGKMTVVLLLSLSGFLYAHEASVWSIKDLNETKNLLSLWSGHEKCAANNSCESTSPCMHLHHGYEEWCIHVCSEDSDCENHRKCRKLWYQKYCHWIQCNSNYDCKNSVCVRESTGQGYCYRVCNCGYNGTCRFEKNKKICNCAAGFVEKDGTCTACNCGDKGNCRIERGRKICDCKRGILENDGTCTECYCGEEGKCRMEKGQKRCDCVQGFAEIDGTCKACNCGANGNCRFEKGKKKCDCYPGFVEKNGTCSDCICRGGACVMEGGKEVCKCPPGFGNFTNFSCRACDCGPDINCIWEARFGGDKICLCKPGYSTKKGKCAACECGPDSNCEWISEGWLKPEKKVCHCKPGDFEENGKCVDPCMPNPCKNDGKCQSTGKGFKCNCTEPWRGETCETACICTGGECLLEGGKPVCKCPPGFGNFTNKSCKACDCGPDINCLWETGVFGNKICLCKPGYSTKKGKCAECECGSQGVCRFVNGQKKCQCEKGLVEIDGTCRDPCTPNPCKNNGKCEITRQGFKCNCTEPWKGKTCETDCICTGGECVLEGGKAVCKCPLGFGNYTNESCKACDCGLNINCIWEAGFLGKKICLCKPGHHVKKGKCVESCMPNPCKNNGKCEITTQGFKCICAGTWRGETCESACSCRGGECVLEGGKAICKCPPGFGNVTNNSCKACDCGPDTNCIWEAGFLGKKICFCKPGYSTKKGKCVGCDCGPNSNCEWISGGWLNPEKKVCHCKSGYHEKDGKCVGKQDSGSYPSVLNG